MKRLIAALLSLACSISFAQQAPVFDSVRVRNGASITGTWTGSTGELNVDHLTLTDPLPFSEGGIGDATGAGALKVLRINAGATGLEWVAPGAGHTQNTDTGTNAATWTQGVGGDGFDTDYVYVISDGWSGTGAAPQWKWDKQDGGDNRFEFNKALFSDVSLAAPDGAFSDDVTVGDDLAVTGDLSAATLSLTTPATVPNGGTGASSFTANAPLYGNGSGAIQAGTINSSSTQKYWGQISSGVPGWVQGAFSHLSGSAAAGQLPNLPDLNGTLDIPGGGTNIASYTSGDMLMATGATVLGRLPIGSAGYVMTVSSGNLPQWASNIEAGRMPINGIWPISALSLIPSGPDLLINGQYREYTGTYTQSQSGTLVKIQNAQMRAESSFDGSGVWTTRALPIPFQVVGHNGTSNLLKVGASAVVTIGAPISGVDPISFSGSTGPFIACQTAAFTDPQAILVTNGSAPGAIAGEYLMADQDVHAGDKVYTRTGGFRSYGNFGFNYDAIDGTLDMYPITWATGTNLAWPKAASFQDAAGTHFDHIAGVSGRATALPFIFDKDLRISVLTASTVPYLDANKQFASSAVTPTELGYVSGVTSALQTQLNGKAATGSTNTFTALQTVHSLDINNADNAGQATITSGNTSVTVNTSAVTSTDVIIVTWATSQGFADTGDSPSVSDISAGVSFTVKTWQETAVGGDAAFNWRIIH